MDASGFPNPHGVAIDRSGTLFHEQYRPAGESHPADPGEWQGDQADRSAPVLHAGDKEVEFDFSALSFISPRKMRVLSIKLSGVDAAWVEAGTRPEREV